MIAITNIIIQKIIYEPLDDKSNHNFFLYKVTSNDKDIIPTIKTKSSIPNQKKRCDIELKESSGVAT